MKPIALLLLAGLAVLGTISAAPYNPALIVANIDTGTLCSNGIQAVHALHLPAAPRLHPCTVNLTVFLQPSYLLQIAPSQTSSTLQHSTPQTH